jgi:D-alanyl-D-alanine carboxypeptidase
MLKLSAICVATLILLQTPNSVAQSAPVAATAQSLSEQLDASIGANYKAGDPGVTVLIAKNGKPLLRKAYGMANIDKKEPLSANMSLRLGSITKQFTAVGILMLAEEGKLALSDDIGKHLPDFPAKGKKITIEHLLTHTSGIPSYTGKPSFVENIGKDMTVQQMIDTFKNDPLEFDPGTRYAYNNSGYFLLGAIIEKLSGQSYAKFVERRFFVPLKMTQSAYEGFERGPAKRAAGHKRGEKGFTAADAISMTQPYAAGALVSTVDDLNRWDQAISAGKLLKPASWKRAFTPYLLANGTSTDYGYGWAIGKLQGSPMVSHGGGINGFSTFALRLPKEKLFVTVLGNTETGNVAPGMVAFKAAALALGKPYPVYKAITLDEKALEAYTGVYKIDDKNTRMVRRDKDKLVMQRSGGGLVPLLAHSPTGFYVDKALTSIEFVRDAGGAVVQMNVDGGGNVAVHPRIGPLPVDRVEIKVSAKVLDSYVGRYQLAPNFVMEVSRDGEKFSVQATNQPKFELFATSETEFFMKAVDAQVKFTQNADGSHLLVLNQGGRTMPAALIK